MRYMMNESIIFELGVFSGMLGIIEKDHSWKIETARNSNLIISGFSNSVDEAYQDIEREYFKVFLKS